MSQGAAPNLMAQSGPLLGAMQSQPFLVAAPNMMAQSGPLLGGMPSPRASLAATLVTPRRSSSFTSLTREDTSQLTQTLQLEGQSQQLVMESVNSAPQHGDSG